MGVLRGRRGVSWRMRALGEVGRRFRLAGVGNSAFWFCAACVSRGRRGEAGVRTELLQRFRVAGGGN